MLDYVSPTVSMVPFGALTLGFPSTLSLTKSSMFLSNFRRRPKFVTPQRCKSSFYANKQTKHHTLHFCVAYNLTVM